MSAAITVETMATTAYSAYTKAEVVTKKSLAQIMAATVQVTELAAKWITNKAMCMATVDLVVVDLAAVVLVAVVAAADTATITVVDNTDSVVMMVVTADSPQSTTIEVAAAAVAAAYTKVKAVVKKSFV